VRHLLDVNVIVGVLRADSPLHAHARAWLHGTTGAVLALPETLAAAVRVLTNDRIWAQVPTVDEATVASGQLTHRDVPDALLAAQARAMDAELVTFDRGFRDYPGLRVQIL
jgi:predicted nucleic acid-binding protein